MKKTELRNRIAAVTLWLLCTFLFGCSAAMLQSSEAPVPQPEPAGSGADDEVLEETVVTGSKAPRRGDWRSRNVPEPTTLGIAPSAQAFASGNERPYASDEEIWVISKPSQADTPADSEDPGTGTMLTHVDDREVPLPLRHTAVSANILGYISTVDVSQQFTNPFDSKIEAVYRFPLPEKAAVSEFLMVIGDRKIRGILREKKEAREIYNAARSQGYQASLLTQHRPNIFEQKVANIEPGKSIDIEIKYFHTLAYNDGWYSFVFPTVVGPRYNPAGTDDPIGALPRNEVGSKAAAIRYLRPDERSGHDIGIDVRINAGVKIEEVRSTHAIEATRPEPGQAVVKLANNTAIPNKDFIIDFRVAGDTMKTNMLTWVDPKTQQGYFSMMMYPPARTDTLHRQPMEMVFVIDASGSMNGVPISQAKAAVNAALSSLQEGDTFQIIRFSDNASQFGPNPVLATRDNIARARQFLRNLHGGGGTQMVEGVRAALEFPHDESRLRFVSFLTDGYIGNEAEILKVIHHDLGSSRIFSFGVGSSVNRYLMERMAGVGKGAVAYLGPQDSGREVMDSFFERISHPAMTDIEIDWNGMAVSDVYPVRYPDLFVGRPLVVTGKFSGAANPVTVSGRAANSERQVRIELTGGGGPDASYLAKIWARMRIAELVDRQSQLGDAGNEYANSIRDTALRYQLMSVYTSFVAVDSSQRTTGDHGTTVHQAVPVPDGVRYETTLGQE